MFCFLVEAIHITLKRDNKNLSAGQNLLRCQLLFKLDGSYRSSLRHLAQLPNFSGFTQAWQALLFHGNFILPPYYNSKEGLAEYETPTGLHKNT